MKTFVLFAFLFTLSGIYEESGNLGEEICLSNEEKKLYNMVLEYRKSKNLEGIPISAKLTQVAQAHVRDLAAHYNFKSDNKCNPHSWSKHGDWSSCCYTNDHRVASCMWDKPKEIAGYSSPGFEIAYYSSTGASAEQGIAGWKKSPSHNPLLINSGQWAKVKWKAIGIGIYKEYGVIWFGELADESPISSCL